MKSSKQKDAAPAGQRLEPPAPSGRNARTVGFALAAIVAVGILAYANSLHGTFQFDDMRTIRFNFSLRDLTDWKGIFQFERYRPLLMATFALNFAISGHDTYSYHVANLIIHLAACILFFFWMRRLHPDWRVAALAAVLMSAHPLNTESVSYISSRSTLLCAVFYFSTLLCFEAHIRRPRALAVAGFVFSFFLAAVTKEEAATIPIAALLYQFVFHGWTSIRKHARLHAITFTLLMAGGILRLSTVFGPGRVLPYTLSVWIPTETLVWLRYLRLAFYPAGLTVDPQVAPLSFASPLFWVAAAGVCTIGWLLWRIRRTHAIVAFWGAWFFLNLLPSSSLIPLNDFMAEHRSYISVFGFCGALSYFLIAICLPRAKPAWIFGVIIALLVAFYVGATHYRNRVWADEFTLWYDAVQKAPDSVRPCMNLGAAYISKEAYDLAIQQYLKALKVNPRLQYAYSGLGICYLRKNDYKSAEMYFRDALSIDPSMIDAQAGMAIVYHRKDRCAEALPLFERVFPHRRESIQVAAMMADCYMKVGRPADAVTYILHGIELGSRDRAWYSNLIRASYAAGRKVEAGRYYDLYRDRLSQDALTQYRMADILIGLGRTAEAAQILVRISTDPRYGDAARKRLTSLTALRQEQGME